MSIRLHSIRGVTVDVPLPTEGRSLMPLVQILRRAIDREKGHVQDLQAHITHLENELAAQDARMLTQASVIRSLKDQLRKSAMKRRIDEMHSRLMSRSR